MSRCPSRPPNASSPLSTWRTRPRPWPSSGNLNQAALFKVGLELFTAEGPALLQEIQAPGKGVFLDLKLHDIPNTVGEAARIGVRHGARMMTIHASGGREMMARAAETAGRGSGQTGLRPADPSRRHDPDQPAERRPGVRRDDARHAGPGSPPGRAGQGRRDSPASSVRPRRSKSSGRKSGPDFLIVTPGIRPAGRRRPGPETGDDAGPGGGERIGLPGHREADHAGGLPRRGVRENRPGARIRLIIPE